MTVYTSYKTDLYLWDCFRKRNLCLITVSLTSPNAKKSSGILDSGYIFSKYHLKLLHSFFSRNSFLAVISPYSVFFTPAIYKNSICENKNIMTCCLACIYIVIETEIIQGGESCGLNDSVHVLM